LKFIVIYFDLKGVQLICFIITK